MLSRGIGLFCALKLFNRLAKYLSQPNYYCCYKGDFYMKIGKVNLKQKFEAFSDQWSPKVVGALNGQQVKLAKLQGEFVWHQHEEEDELFYVVKGILTMAFQDQTVNIHEGEFLIVPKGVEHKPIAKKEVHVMLFEPASTVNTGNVQNNLTQDEENWV